MGIAAKLLENSRATSIIVIICCIVYIAVLQLWLEFCGGNPRLDCNSSKYLIFLCTGTAVVKIGAFYS